jgi:hypothetical protein
VTIAAVVLDPFNGDPARRFALRRRAVAHRVRDVIGANGRLSGSAKRPESATCVRCAVTAGTATAFRVVLAAPLRGRASSLNWRARISDIPVVIMVTG